MGAHAIADQPERSPERVNLAIRAGRGDLAAFEQLYEENVNRIYAICLRMTGNPSHADDLTQAVFIRAWEKLKTFRGDSEPSTWLRRVAINIVLADRRSLGRRRSKESELDALETYEPAGLEENPGTGIDLEKAIAQLPTAARQVLVLHDIEGYRHREVAEAMGIATGTSKAQLHRARKLLREVLTR